MEVGDIVMIAIDESRREGKAGQAQAGSHPPAQSNKTASFS